MFRAEGIDVAVFSNQLDVQFLATVEGMYDPNVKYLRIDSDVAKALKTEDVAKENTALTTLFQKVSGNEKLKVAFATLKDTSVPLLLTISEESRRLDEMMKLYSMGGMDFGMQHTTDATLTVNTACPLVEKLEHMEGEKQEKTASYLYRLALLSQRKLSAEELEKFLKDSYSMLGSIE